MGNVDARPIAGNWQCVAELVSSPVRHLMSKESILKVISVLGTIVGAVVLAYFAFDVAVLTVSIVASVAIILGGAYVLIFSKPGNEASIKLYSLIAKLRTKFL